MLLQDPATASPRNLRELLDLNPVAGTPKSGTKRFWTNRELSILETHFPKGGVPACIDKLPGRTASGIYRMARAKELESPKSPKQPIQRWTPDPAIDRVIQQRVPNATHRRDILNLAQTVGRPAWWVSKRARQLGLIQPRVKEPEWKEREIEILRTFAHLSNETIARRLRKEGFTRTATAVKVKLVRLQAVRENPDYYSARGLARLMGVDNTTVSRWIREKMLHAERRGTQRVAAQGGDEHWISRRQVKAFVIAHTAHVDLRKVDKFWFVGLLTGQGDR